jgi:hypothetical protein
MLPQRRPMGSRRLAVEKQRTTLVRLPFIGAVTYFAVALAVARLDRP